MANKIDKKIVSWAVKDNAPTEKIELLSKEDWELRYPIQQVIPEKKNPEKLARDAILTGKSYKIRTSKEEHSLYITINDQVINGELQAFEIFINSKNVMHQQWMTALTRVISAVFRISNDPSFLIEELASVFDANGGHFTKGSKTKKGKFMPSLVAEIGEVINLHLEHIKIENSKIEKQEQIIDIPLEKVVNTVLDVIVEEVSASDETLEKEIYPKNSELCPECYNLSAIRLDGCLTCLNSDCNYSKCG